jgi:hypothetical protein
MASLSERCNFIKRRLAAQSYLARDTWRDLPSIRSSTFALTCSSLSKNPLDGASAAYRNQAQRLLAERDVTSSHR